MTEKQIISGFLSSQDLSRLCCCLRFQRKSRYFSKIAMEMLHLSFNVLQLSFYMLIHYSISNDYDSHFALIVLSITMQMYLKVRNKTFHDIWELSLTVLNIVLTILAFGNFDSGHAFWYCLGSLFLFSSIDVCNLSTTLQGSRYLSLLYVAHIPVRALVLDFFHISTRIFIYREILLWHSCLLSSIGPENLITTLEDTFIILIMLTTTMFVGAIIQTINCVIENATEANIRYLKGVLETKRGLNDYEDFTSILENITISRRDTVILYLAMTLGVFIFIASLVALPYFVVIRPYPTTCYHFTT